MKMSMNVILFKQQYNALSTTFLITMLHYRYSMNSPLETIQDLTRRLKDLADRL